MFTVKVITIVLCTVCCISAIDGHVAREDNTDVDQCLKDERTARTYLKCSSFPFFVIPSLDICCSDENAFLLCEACLNARDSCEALMHEIEVINSLSEDRSDSDDFYDNMDDLEDLEEDVDTADDYSIQNSYSVQNNVEKRFGRLFLNRNPKRLGKIFFGKRSDQQIDGYKNGIERILMGHGKTNEMDKNYGKLFTTSNHYFGKRTPYLKDKAFLDDNYDVFDRGDLDISKRYGRIYMGNRKNKMLGNRYGRIFFGKRSNEDTDNMFRTMHPGNNGNFLQQPDDMSMDKRYGRLFTGRRNYYFGK